MATQPPSQDWTTPRNSQSKPKRERWIGLMSGHPWVCPHQSCSSDQWCASESSLCFSLDYGAAFRAHKMNSFWMKLNLKMRSNCYKAFSPPSPACSLSWVKLHNAYRRTKSPTPTFTPQSCSYHTTLLASTDMSVSKPHSCSLASLSSIHTIPPASFDSLIISEGCITVEDRKTDKFSLL